MQSLLHHNDSLSEIQTFCRILKGSMCPECVYLMMTFKAMTNLETQIVILKAVSVHLKESQRYFKRGVGMLDEACDRYYQFNSPYLLITVGISHLKIISLAHMLSVVCGKLFALDIRRRQGDSLSESFDLASGIC